MKKTLMCMLLISLAIAPTFAADLVRLGTLKFAHFAPVWYTKEIATKYNLQIQERVFPKGIDIIPAIIAGEIDVASSGADGAIGARASNVPIVIVAGFGKGGARIVGRPDIKWNSIADLKGKKVGVTRGGTQELVLLAELGKYNLTFGERTGKDVQLLYIIYPDLNQALQAKDIDAICQSEPQSTQAIKQGFGVEIIKPYDTPLGEPVRTVMMTEEMYNNKNDVAERFLKCFVEATQYFIDNPQGGERYVREKMFKGQLTSEEYRDAMENCSITCDITIEHIQASTDLMAKYGIARMINPPAAKNYVKTDLLEKAKKELKFK